MTEPTFRLQRKLTLPSESLSRASFVSTGTAERAFVYIYFFHLFANEQHRCTFAAAVI